MKRSLEEILNAITHYTGAIFSLIGLILIITHSVKIGKDWLYFWLRDIWF